MAVPLPDPYVVPSGNDSAALLEGLQRVQRDLDALAQAFPIHAGLVRDGAVGTTQLAANAATKLHTTTASTDGPTQTNTTSATATVLSEMTVTADFGGNPVLIIFTGQFSSDTANTFVAVELFDAGTAVATALRAPNPSAANEHFEISLTHGYTPATGSRTLQIRWWTGAGTATSLSTRRNLAILELRR